MAEVNVLCPNCRRANPRNDQTLRRARFCQHCGHDIVLNNAQSEQGPRFYITRVIKEGGQGAVYQTIGDDWKPYAVKEMLDRFSDQRERNEATERFRTEAILLQGLRHPRIPRVYAHFEDEGRHYLAMEFIEGEDLEQIVEREGPLDEARVLAIADQVCDVLEYLHGRGLIYRDMKPSNVMLDRSNGVKLIDFGIANLFERADRGAQIGTPGYAPPEQYQGLTSIESDIYSLGATLHHLLTRRDPRDEPPFSFPPLRQLRPQIARRTAEAIGRALQMKPEDRFRSVAEFRAALRPLPERPPEVRRAPPATTRPAAAAARPAAAAVPTANDKLPSKPQAQPPARQRGGVLQALARMLVLLLIVVLLGGIGLFFARPDLVQQYMPGLLPSSAPTQVQTLSQPIPLELLVTLPDNADADAVRQAFLTEYTKQIQQQYGQGARVNVATFAYVGSQPRVVSQGASTTTYSASCEAFVTPGS
ncbi:MAG: serine/threonine-protein kinase [Roseiflexaceae bacterium]